MVLSCDLRRFFLITTFLSLALALSVAGKDKRSGDLVNHRQLIKDIPELAYSRIQRSASESTPAIAAAVTSVCTGLCNCTKEKEIFINVVCDFTENSKYVLDDHHTVPTNSLTFHVNLGPHTQLSVRGKLFRRINRISIDGGREGGRQQIDFGPRSFHDNTAPFPEIDLKHAQTLTIHGNAFQGDFKLNVANVANVIVQGNAFQNTSFIAHFTSVHNLRFEKDAFLGTRDSQIQIVDSNVGLLERMDASMQEIKLQNSRIDAIKANTFDVVSIRSIVFDNCDINVIESNFTTEKLLSHYLGIIGSRIGTIKANAIANSGFSVLEMERNTIQSIETGAITANAINVTVSNNVVHKTGPGWLTVREWSAVAMINNSVGHLDKVDVLGQGKTCVFAHNSITQWTEGALGHMAGSCAFQDNVFSTPCTCNNQWIESLSPGNKDLRKTSYCQLESNLRHCFNATSFNAAKFHNMLCEETPLLDCTLTISEKKIEGKFLDPNDFVGGAKNYTKYLILGGGLACIVIIAVFLCLLVRMRCSRKTTANDSSRGAITSPVHVPSSDRDAMPFTVSTNQRKPGKSFSANDRAIVDLSLERLRTKYSEELHEQVKVYTDKLMTDQLSETEKVLTIGEIVRLLDECENIGDDFLAFTDILYRHLDENNGQVEEGHTTVLVNVGGDPLYAQPGIMAPTTNVDSDNHIYAEPNSAQQPLLKTEYSLPLDTNNQVNVYADPVEMQRGKSSRLVTPYAIGNQLSLGASSSSPGTNLPDVLSRTVPVVAATPPPLPAPKLNTFGKGSPVTPVAGPSSRGVIPMYSIPQKGNQGETKKNPRGVPLQRDDSSSSSCNSASNHSGGSDITFKIDDMDFVES